MKIQLRRYGKKNMSDNCSNMSYHIDYSDSAISEDNGIWRCSHGQHESKGGCQSCWEHVVEGMNPCVYGLQDKIKYENIGMKSVFLAIYVKKRGATFLVVLYYGYNF